MRSNDRVRERQTGSGNRFRRLTPWVFAGALIPALISAQSLTTPRLPAAPMVTVLKSAQYSIFGGHSFALRVNDAGAADAATEVTLEFRDADDQQRAFKSAVLRGRHSV